ncbi:MAG: cache domain-containing protein [Anaerolineae bacterium]|nr:cache domain-containing protein [Anaerolineae bacterium]
MKRGLKRIFQPLRGLFRGYLHRVLLGAFFFVAFVPVAFGSLAISRVIQDYLGYATTERVNRDMNLAQAFYDSARRQVSAVAFSLALDNELPEYLTPENIANEETIRLMERMIQNRIVSNELEGTQFIGVFKPDGHLVAGRVLYAFGVHRPVRRDMDWSRLPIVAAALQQGVLTSGTEIIPAEYLEPIGLAEQARIPLIETPRAAPEPFDPREGTAGLALTAVAPARGPANEIIGFVVVLQMFNRDFTLVDRIKQIAGVDTSTIFLGDWRVSTNVLTEAGERAIGTRLSEEVARVVLYEGREYTGRAFVVKENFITRYSPLRDHANQIVGILYVGAREEAFLSLVRDFNRRVVLIAVVSILIAVALSLPLARSITEPIITMVAASAKVAGGDMTVRVPEKGRGELRQLSEAFNRMVNELQTTEDELLHARNLASIGQLAAGVAHEINNPLGTIMLYSDILNRDVPPDSPIHDDLQMISREAARCKEIVTALLNFARQSRVMAQETDVNGVVRELASDLDRLPLYENVVIVQKLEPNLPLIQADPTQLRQVLVNLANNAAEAMPDGGTLTFSTSLDPAGDRVRISVEDTGIGIPPENIPKLFTPFFTTKPIGRGTGLGLAITYGIVKMHRGQITVQSEVGKGTRFTMILPVRIAQAQPTALDEEAAAL